MEKYNLAKYIAHCGICSRREAEELILDRKVSVNNKLVDDMTYDISDYDSVAVNGIEISLIDQVKLYLFYKPRGCIVSRSDDQDRKTIYDLIPKSLGRLVSVGRLDYNSEGLLLLTNYGPLARYFELPQNEIKRTYELKLFGEWDNKYIEFLRNGVRVEGIKYKPINCRVLKNNQKQVRVECTLTEGKNLELRKIFKNFGFLVSKLKRVSYGHFKIGNMNQGEIIECRKFIVDKLMGEAKLKIAKNNFG